LYWTNAWEADDPSNWAWWQLTLAEAGLYRVDVHVDPTYGVGDNVAYEVRAAGVDNTVILDQSAASGWRTLGDFTFAAGGDQWVALSDATGDASTNEHITADAIRLTRLDLPDDPADTAADSGAPDSAGDTAGDTTGDTAGDTTGDTAGAEPSTAGPGALVPLPQGCSCGGGGAGATLVVLVAVGAGRRRRR